MLEWYDNKYDNNLMHVKVCLAQFMEFIEAS